MHRAFPASYHPCWLHQWWVWKRVQWWHQYWWISAGKGRYSVQRIWSGTLSASSWCAHWGSAEFSTEGPGCTSRTAGQAGLEVEKSLYFKQLTTEIFTFLDHINCSCRFPIKKCSSFLVKRVFCGKNNTLTTVLSFRSNTLKNERTCTHFYWIFSRFVHTHWWWANESTLRI